MDDAKTRILRRVQLKRWRDGFIDQVRVENIEAIAFDDFGGWVVRIEMCPIVPTPIKPGSNVIQESRLPGCIFVGPWPPLWLSALNFFRALTPFFVIVDVTCTKLGNGLRKPFWCVSRNRDFIATRAMR